MKGYKYITQNTKNLGYPVAMLGDDIDYCDI